MQQKTGMSAWVARCHAGTAGLVLLALFGSRGHAQAASATAPTNVTDLTDATAVAGFQPVGQSLEAAESGEHFQNWNNVTTLRDDKGNTMLQTNLGYVEWQTGMHYRDGEKWVAAQEIIEAYPGGAIARQGGHKVIFAENLNREVVIDLQTPDGQRLQSRVLGLSYRDSASGKSVLFAVVKDCPGQILGSNQVLYADAFTGCLAGMRYTYTKAGLEQDVILGARPPTPENFGLDSTTTRLQVLTEFLSAPAPAIKTTRLPAATGGLEDQTLDFGAMQMPQGKSFTIGSDNASSEPVPVAKRWAVIDGRTILFEEVSLPQLAEQLQTLPVPKRTAFFRRKPERQIASTTLHLPARGTTKPAPRAMRMAKLSPPLRGVVLDYSLLASAANVTLHGDKTYYVSGTVNLSGTTTIEGGTVVKYANTSTARINFTGPVVCQTSPYRPAIFTSMNDDTVGEMISGSNHNPVKSTVNTYLLNNGSAASYQYLRFVYAGTAVSDQYLVDIWHSQFLNCTTAVFKSTGDILLRNILFTSCTTCVRTHDNVDGQHLTVDACPRFAHTQVSDGMILNSIFTAVTAVGDVTLSSSCWQQSSSSGVYQTVGAGAYYLTDFSRIAGTPDINPTLLADLKQKTTYPPVELTSDFTTDAVLDPNPAVVRNACSNPSLGYHYDPLDYVLSGLTLSGATLTMRGGVAIGVYGLNGIKLGVGAKLNSYGLPASLNRLVRYQTVQETPMVWGATGSIMDLLEVVTATSPLPEVRMQFTDVSVMSDASGKRQFMLNSLLKQFKLLVLTDCTLRGCVLDLGTRVHSFICMGCETTSVALTNCLWLRAYLGSSQGGGGDQTPWSTFLYNNLFVGGAVNLDNEGGSGTWAVYDNLFDTVNLSSYGTCPNGNNAYKSTTALTGGSNNKTLSTCDYVSGFLGDYYYSTAGGSGHLSELIDAGSRTAVVAKLDGHTTRTDQVPDTGIVDVGFHYVALAEAGITEWVFTDRGFITGGQDGALRTYYDPNDVTGSPWSFQSTDKSSLRMSFENDFNCANPFYNPLTQEGTAVATIWINSPTRMTVGWSGVGETQDSNYEKMSLFVECGLVGSAHAPGGSLGCAGGMAPVVSDPSPPQYIDLEPGVHFLRIETTTNDPLYHIGAYYQFALSFEPL